MVTSATGAVVSQQAYDPWRRVRSGDIPQTSLDYTGQRKDGTGLLDYHARYYDPVLGKFISPDSIVPRTAAGSGGGAATLGYDERTELRPLTVDFHEPGFASGLNAENAYAQAVGFWFQLDGEAGAQAKVGWGSANPQLKSLHKSVKGQRNTRVTDRIAAA